MNTETKTLDRVVVTRPFVGLLYMQVCACNDATDEEILEVCNSKNECGTTNGWMSVIRSPEADAENTGPVPCVDHADRTHFLVAC
jgi:hypothetical protein